MSFTDDLEDEILEEKYHAPGETYTIGIFSASPTDTADLTNEIAILRQPIVLTDVSGGQPLTNVGQIEWSAMPNDGGTPAGSNVSHIAIFRDSDGKMVSHGALSGTVRVPAGQTLRAPIGAIRVELD